MPDLLLDLKKKSREISRKFSDIFFEYFSVFLKGDIPLPVFLVNDKNCTDLNFSHFFCELGLKMLGPQQWQLMHVEKNDQVIRHNNRKTWETKEKSIRKAFLFKTLVKN
jgi:hypothetical protein